MKRWGILIVVALAGCAPDPVVVDTASLCKSWRHQTVSKEDRLSQGTAEIADGNNRSRPNFGCVYGRNEAKG